MKKLSRCFVNCLLSSLSLGAAVVHSSSLHTNSVHLQLQMNSGQQQHEHLFSAGKFAHGPSPEFSVRVVYFHPSDLEPHSDIDVKLNSYVKYVQSFYADEMERNGYGRKTFRLEIDSAGSAVVHRVTGKFANSHYIRGNALSEADAEISEKLGRSKYVVYLMWVDLDDPEPGKFSQVGGNADGNSFGGTARIKALDYRWTTTPSHLFTRTWTTIAHELGHAFGLPHDFRDDRYVMSYGDYMLTNRLSPCAANWLDAHRYFSVSQSYQDRPAAIEMRPPVLALPPNTIRLRFQVTDADGIHQARLVSDVIDPTKQQSGDKVLECKSLNGDSETEDIEFTTNSLAARSEYVGLQVMDVSGNFIHRRFNIDVSSLRPPTDIVSIPDQRLEASIKKNINKDQGSVITLTDMLDLTTLVARNNGITDLTGLANAKNLIYVDFADNQISDISPFAGLTRLRSIVINKNRIGDVTALSRLAELSELWLSDNRIGDLKPLSGLTNLTYLVISGNQVRDIEPLAGLSKLRGLHLGRNQISDIAPLMELKQLGDLILTRNQISDVSPVTKLVNLDQLYLRGNPIGDTSPLRELLRQNPTVQIDIHVPRLALVIISGDEQEGPAGSTLVNSLVVEVRDLYDNPVSDSSVTFVVTAGGGTLFATTVATGENGRASTTLTLGRQPGTNTVVATVGDLEPVTFTATGKAHADFDGNGTVGFSDFVQFAGKFGLSQGDEGYDARFDLDGNGAVGFSDFVIFAGAFGKS